MANIDRTSREFLLETLELKRAACWERMMRANTDSASDSVVFGRNHDTLTHVNAALDEIKRRI